MLQDFYQEYFSVLALVVHPLILFHPIFGGAGMIATGFLTNYQIPLRILSMLFMVLAFYVMYGRTMKSCRMNYGSLKKGKSKKNKRIDGL